MRFYPFYILGYRCNQCKYSKLSEQFKPNFECIKEEFNKEGCTLLSTKYDSRDIPLQFICPNGHNTKMCYKAWKDSDYKCYSCYLEILQKSKSFTFEQVKEMFEIKKCKLLSTSYTNARQHLEYICPNGHDNSITLDGFNRVDTVVCGYCSKTYKYTLDDIKKEFENVGYVILSKEYVDARTPLKFKCDNGHVHKISWTHFAEGQRCAKCICNRGTGACITYLDQQKLQYNQEKTFPRCKYKYLLRFDLYVDNSFLIEFDGMQHFEPITYFGGDDAHKSQVKKDIIKNLYCAISNTPLLRISYKEIKKIPELIDSFLNELKNWNRLTPLISFSNKLLYEQQINMYNSIKSTLLNI